MRAVVQRVKKASVTVKAENKVSEINEGLVVFLGVEEGDIIKDAEYLAEKIVNLRIFEDENDKMNMSLLDVKGELLVVSQFTLLGDCRKGRRPSFIAAASPDLGNKLYEKFIEISQNYVHVAHGTFQTDMDVELINNGPVTILLDSRKKF